MRVVVAAREQRAHDEPDIRPRPPAAASERRDRRAVLDDELVRRRPCRPRQLVGPARPRVVRERGEPRDAVGMHDVGRVALGREREAAARGLDPGFEAVDEHHAAGRRRRRGQQQRVIAARADAARVPDAKPPRPSASSHSAVGTVMQPPVLLPATNLPRSPPARAPVGDTGGRAAAVRAGMRASPLAAGFPRRSRTPAATARRARDTRARGCGRDHRCWSIRT